MQREQIHLAIVTSHKGMYRSLEQLILHALHVFNHFIRATSFPIFQFTPSSSIRRIFFRWKHEFRCKISIRAHILFINNSFNPRSRFVIDFLQAVRSYASTREKIYLDLSKRKEKEKSESIKVKEERKILRDFDHDFTLLSFLAASIVKNVTSVLKIYA